MAGFVEGIFSFACDNTTAIIALVVILLAVRYLTGGGVADSRAPLPPGPAGWPLVGALPYLFGKTHIRFNEWADKYGPIVYFKIASQEVVVLNSIEATREAWVKHGDAFVGRPSNFITETINKNMGILSSSGSDWKEQRRFALSTLRDFGMGKVRLEESILDEAKALVKVIEAKNGQPFDAHYLIMTSVCNVIYSMVFGKRYDHNDSELDGLTSRLNENLQNAVLLNMFMTPFPWLRHLPGDMLKYWKVVENIDFVEGALKEQIEEHKRTYDPNVTRDYIDAYITKMKEVSIAGDASSTSFYDKQLIKVAGDLFAAGTETTSTTLRWALLYMLHHPEVQDKVYNLIDDKIGDSLPSLKNRKDLVYVEATINEVLRISNLVAGGVPHLTTDDVIVSGYRIPKGSISLVNFGRVMEDPQHWDEPEEFRPERFIDSEGKLSLPQSFIPFSIGKRACVGESLAKMELFLFFTYLMKHFRFIPEEPGKLPIQDGPIGLVRAPYPFKLRAIKRS